MRLSAKIANILLGQHGNLDGKISTRATLRYPDGQEFTWKGGDGLIWTLIWKIRTLEKEVESLKHSSHCK